MYRNKVSIISIAAFAVVLLSMPLGHAAMILMELFLPANLLTPAACLLGVIGIVLVMWGNHIENDTKATLLGFFGGLLVWTGWIEFSYVYFAKVLSVSPLIENGVVTTKPEYLLLMSSVGFWAVIMAFYIFRLNSDCLLFLWIQQKTGLKTTSLKPCAGTNKSWTTYMETIMLLWTCYLVLMFAYDKKYMGDDHPGIILIAISCFICSLWMMNKLRKITKMGFAIRYALPTVIIFWTFIEIMGRLNWLSEIWISPHIYVIELTGMTICFIVGIIFAIRYKSNRPQKKIDKNNNQISQ